jgi:hypothetical protein
MLATSVIPREPQNLPDECKWMMVMRRRHVTEGLGTSNMNKYELANIERLLDTHNSSWDEGKGQEKAPS